MARVLVHEPDPDLRALFAHVLSRLGHEVVLAGDGGVDAALVPSGPVWSIADQPVFIRSSQESG